MPHDPRYEELLQAARDGKLTQVKKLLAAGVDQNTPVGAPRGWSPLMMAAYHGKLAVVKYLVSQGARLDFVEVDGWWTALDLALHGNRKTVATYLRSIKAPLGASIPNPHRGGKLGGWVTDER